MIGKVLIGLGLSAMLIVGGGGAALAGKAHQGASCENGGSPPGGGQSSNSPGSPFHDGNGGQNYSEKSQYDVACFRGPSK